MPEKVGLFFYFYYTVFIVCRLKKIWDYLYSSSAADDAEMFNFETN